MRDPRAISAGSNMPAFPWLFEAETDVAALPTKISVQRVLGVPFAEMTPAEIQASVQAQAEEIAADLRTQGNYTEPSKEIVALIAYLQKLGKSEPVKKHVASKPAP
jgi:cytochrome c oxidase cbb3-type subunit I/II